MKYLKNICIMTLLTVFFIQQTISKYIVWQNWKWFTSLKLSKIIPGFLTYSSHYNEIVKDLWMKRDGGALPHYSLYVWKEGGGSQTNQKGGGGFFSRSQTIGIPPLSLQKFLAASLNLEGQYLLVNALPV